MNIEELIKQIKENPNCLAYEPSGVPVVSQHHIIPNDLRLFYTIYGGATFFPGSNYCTNILPPDKFLLANPQIVGTVVEGDISSSWYTIADNGSSDFITIDLNKNRNGRCYDSFFDRHAVAGSCPIIALTFTDLIENLLTNQGEYWYWLRPDFKPLGDAYDEQIN